MAQLSKRIREQRSVAIFAGLILLSLVSIASGAQGGPIAQGISSITATASRPFLQAMNFTQGSVAYLSSFVLDRNAYLDERDRYEESFLLMLQHSAERSELLAENERLRALMEFERQRPQYTMMPAQVLQHSQGLLTIDRGTFHGLRESLCVVTKDGVIGIIVRADWVTSIVATLQDSQCRIDAMIKRSRVRGTVHGSTTDLSRLCELRYIELKQDVREGDVILTSPDSVFPTGFPIGVVQSVEHDPGSIWKSASLLPAVDPYSVDEVFIVLRADTRWQELAAGDNETPAPAPLADNQSVQERYAP